MLNISFASSDSAPAKTVSSESCVSAKDADENDGSVHSFKEYMDSLSNTNKKTSATEFLETNNVT